MIHHVFILAVPAFHLTRLSSSFVINLLKYKQERNWEAAAAKQEKKRRQAQAKRDLLDYKRKLEAAAKQEKERQAQLERDNCKDEKEKQERQARQEREREAEKDQKSRAYLELGQMMPEKFKHNFEEKVEAERRDRIEGERKQQAKREREAQQQERERETQQEVREREALRQERERDAKEKQERPQERERGAQQQAREREILEKCKHLKVKFEAEQEKCKYLEEKFEAEQEKCKYLEEKFEEKLKHLDEKVEAERRDRIEGERKMASLIRTVERSNGLLTYTIMRMQRDHHSRYNYQTLEYQEHVKSLAYFDLPEDNDKDLENIFNASLIESSEHLNCERDIEYDIHRLAMTTVNGLEYSQDITVLELNNQLFDDFEDDVVSSAIIPVGNVEGTRAKEEGNAYFKEQKFEEAIKCYSKSIHELPTVAAYRNRALAYIKQNKFIEAEQDCTDALNIDDRYFKAYASRAIARKKLGCNLEGALEDVQVALKLEPNNGEMKELYSEILSLKAAAEADEARERGNKLFNDQKFEEAIIWYTVSINKSPTAVAYSNKAEAYLNLNKLMEAENDCTNALKIDNQCFKAYARRAIARSKLGYNLKGALEDVEAALNLEPTNQKMKELRAKLNQLLG